MPEMKKCSKNLKGIIKNRGGHRPVGIGPPRWLGCGEWWVEELVKNIIVYM
jgi:hypothetical protein